MTRLHVARRAMVIIAAVLFAVPIASLSRPALGASTITVLPVADAYVQSGGPTSNYGRVNLLRVRGPSPAYRSLLKFDVSGLSGSASSARLRLNVSDATRDAGGIYVIPTTWTETTVTWNNQPAIPATPIAVIGAAALGWVEVDLGSAISANGTYAFAIVTTSTDSLYTSSREGANPPQLVLETSAPTPTPTPTSAPTPTPTSAPTPTPTPTSAPTPTPTPTSAPTPTRTFVPVADAQVKQSSPNSNYGSLASLRLRGGGVSDNYRSYLTFVVDSIANPPVSVRLRLFVTDASPDAGMVYVVSSSWSEATITWGTAPALPAGPAVASPGAAAVGSWVEWDLSSVVTGNGTFSLALANGSTNSLYYSSREGTSPPQLVVNGSATPAQPVADFTSGASSGYTPLSVRFADQSSGATSWAWDFQDDGTIDSTAQHPLFTYSAARTYSVRLTVSNAVGSSSLLRSGFISAVEPPPPGPVTGTLVGAGDVADCLVETDSATAALIDDIAGTVFVAGDLAYDTGTAAEFTSCYEPTWGRHRPRTLPAPGNHEYMTSGAAGYFGYFGAAAGDPTKGYYSTDVGGWHVVVLNSNCSKITGGCAAGGAQATWLRADLAASSATCTVAIWHHPLFSSGTHGSGTDVRPLFQALYEAGADVVINGHDHDYERFAPQDALGNLDPSFGIRAFVVGTGGKGLRAFATVAPHREVGDDDTFGVLKLDLHAASYGWTFVPVAGSTFSDVGSTPCHGAPPAG